MEASDAVIVCLSRASVVKEGYVQKELRQVLDVAQEKLEGVIFILPLRLDNCELPRRLRDRQALDYFPEPNRVSAYERVKASLKIRNRSLGI